MWVFFCVCAQSQLLKSRVSQFLVSPDRSSLTTCFAWVVGVATAIVNTQNAGMSELICLCVEVVSSWCAAPWFAILSVSLLAQSFMKSFTSSCCGRRSHECHIASTPKMQGTPGICVNTWSGDVCSLLQANPRAQGQWNRCVRQKFNNDFTLIYYNTSEVLVFNWHLWLHESALCWCQQQKICEVAIPQMNFIFSSSHSIVVNMLIEVWLQWAWVLIECTGTSLSYNSPFKDIIAVISSHKWCEPESDTGKISQHRHIPPGGTIEIRMSGGTVRRLTPSMFSQQQ